MKNLNYLLLTISAMALTACGGSGGGSNAAPSAPIASPGISNPVTPTTTSSSTTMTTQTTSSSVTTTTQGPFVALSCAPYNANTQAQCTDSNLGNSFVVLDFSPYLTAQTQIINVTVQNNLGQGQGNCTSEYLGLTDCSCVSITIQNIISHQLSGPLMFCGTGVNTITNFLEFL